MSQKIRRLKMLKRRGSVFAGEIAGYADPLASKLIAEKCAYEVDENDNRIDSPALIEPTKADEKPAEEHRFNEATDPFMTDGLSKGGSRALHDADIHTVDDLKAFIAAGGDLDAIDDLTDAQVDKIRRIYAS